jgi:hypothetical protein
MYAHILVWKFWTLQNVIKIYFKKKETYASEGQNIISFYLHLG